jgi:hypothetical protein
VYLTFGPSRDTGEGREENEGGERTTRHQADGWVAFILGQNFTQTLRSQRQDALPIQEDHQAQFYKVYRKVAEEYDKEFLKKHDEDLNTTLIFVSSVWSPGAPVLIRLSGRSIFCSSRRVHNPGGL